ncbi:Flp family type IVb pilin [Pseudomonas syringae]|uniref:Flp family type IVb pilin n=1 Tax=Pseudomonas syringae TaxID=317 RepID=A0A085V905_PSESX|nr:Flp family type IVb pilin [Pseudomonas syringae]KFE51918.1 hypothetical protein IV01_22600 [Pseudomonas syringae]
MFLTKINAGAKRLIKNKDGASAIEYVIIAAMVAIVAAAFIEPIGDAVKAKFDLITEKLDGTKPT